MSPFFVCELPRRKQRGFLPKELLSTPKSSQSYILAIGGLPSS